MITVSNDPKFPHANYKCEMCDCYFNDAFAKRAHVKGRRHRLNYKKTYDSSIYVEPTKAMVSACNGAAVVTGVTACVCGLRRRRRWRRGRRHERHSAR